MARYFFNLRGDGQNYEDTQGAEFPTLQLAEMAALRAASLVLEQTPERELLLQRYLEITDVHGVCQVVVPLRSVLLVDAA